MTGSSAVTDDPIAHIAGALLDGRRRVEQALHWIPDIRGLHAIWAHDHAAAPLDAAGVKASTASSDRPRRVARA